MRTVQEDQKRLVNGLQLLHDTPLRVNIIRSGNVRNAAVGSDYDSDRGMVADDLFRSFLSCDAHRHFVVKPRGRDHSFTALIILTGSAGDHIADAVNEPHRRLHAGSELHGYRLLRYEFWFRRHDGPSGSALRQLVSGSLPQVLVFHTRKNERLREPLDKSGFSGAHRTDHADVNIAACTVRNILKN